ncbi:hypothetical protein A4G18_00495 [Pasteurellaceae bacterium Pebbles2]|nr:hypothetical protein [Pasteurellaceae bacterium Pebbles2]
MFSRLESAVKLTALFLLLGLCGWIWVQSQKIDSLIAKNQAQAQTIQTQYKTISQLQRDIELNRKLTDELSKQESDIRGRADDVIKSIPAKVKASDVYNTVAPSNVVEFLHQ